MIVRLVIAWGEKKLKFEHPGPVLHVGKDPSLSEVAVDADKVSRRHVRIELTPAGATLTDVGSTNGTLLNDRPIKAHEPVPLHEGDRVHLGHTGAAVVTVIGLDLTPASARDEPRHDEPTEGVELPDLPDFGPPRAGPPRRGKRLRTRWAVTGVLTALAVLVGAGVGWYVFGGKPVPKPPKDDSVLVPFTQGRQYAVLVGVKDYSPRMTNLEFSENDVVQFGIRLREAGYAVTLMTDGEGKSDKDMLPTAANVNREIDRAVRRCKGGDTLVVAFAGHGYHTSKEGDVGQSYFCPSGADKSKPKTLVSLTELYAKLGKGEGTKLLLVDACRTPGSRDVDPGRIDVNTLPRLGKGVAALYSCTKDESSYEEKGLGEGGGHGYFFHVVLEGLSKEARDRQGEISWADLVKRVYAEVPKLGGPGKTQNPKEESNLSGPSPVLVNWGPKNPPNAVKAVGTVSGDKSSLTAGTLSVTLTSVREKRGEAKTFPAEVKADGAFEVANVPAALYLVSVELLDAEKNDLLKKSFSGPNARLRRVKEGVSLAIDLGDPND